MQKLMQKGREDFDMGTLQSGTCKATAKSRKEDAKLLSLDFRHAWGALATLHSHLHVNSCTVCCCNLCKLATFAQDSLVQCIISTLLLLPKRKS